MHTVGGNTAESSCEPLSVSKPEPARRSDEHDDDAAACGAKFSRPGWHRAPCFLLLAPLLAQALHYAALRVPLLVVQLERFVQPLG
jgi:hypothetical protein